MADSPAIIRVFIQDPPRIVRVLVEDPPRIIRVITPGPPGPAGGLYQPPDGVAYPFQAKADEDRSLLDFRINSADIPDGVDSGTAFSGFDWTAALNEALNYCSSRRIVLRIPRIREGTGKYYFAPPTSAKRTVIDVPSWVHIRADRGAELLVDEDVNLDLANQMLFRSLTHGVSTANDLNELFCVEGLTIRGRWTHQPQAFSAQRRVNIFSIENTKSVILRNNSSYDCTNKFLVGLYNGSLHATGNRLERCASNGIRSIETENALVCDNILQSDDDAIDLLSRDTGISPDRPLRGSLIVERNIIFNSEGIKIAAIRRGSVSHNLFLAPHGTQISLGLALPPEGSGSASEVVVTGNIVENALPRYDPVNLIWTSQSSDQAVLVVGGSLVSQGPGTIFPGNYFDATEGVLAPQGRNAASTTVPTWGYHSIRDHAVQTSAGTFDYVVQGNVIVRTAPAVNAYSDLGHGQYFHRTGFFNPPVSLGDFRRSAIDIMSDVRNMDCSNNVLRGFPQGAGIIFDIRSNNNLTDCEFQNVQIRGNMISDVNYGVTSIRRTDNTTKHNIGVVIDGNTIDVDPYLKSPYRNGFNGTWINSNETGTYPSAINMNGLQGAIVTRNVIKNCLAPFIPQVSAGGRNQMHLDGNILCCKPVGTGFNAANVGIGIIPVSAGNSIYMIWEGNPQDANWNKLLNTCPIDAEAMPTTGIWVRGTMVRNTGPVIATGKVLLGWMRLTTGATHVPNTDWSALYVTNV